MNMAWKLPSLITLYWIEDGTHFVRVWLILGKHLIWKAIINRPDFNSNTDQAVGWCGFYYACSGEEDAMEERCSVGDTDGSFCVCLFVCLVGNYKITFGPCLSALYL